MFVEALMFIVPVLVWLCVVVLYFHFTVTWKEALLQGGITVLVITLVFGAGSYSATHDVKYVNGAVTSKKIKQQSCPWGWNDYTDGFCTEYRTRSVPDGKTCTTDSKGRRSCRTKYKTQYNYIYPWERKYYVFSDIDRTFTISRVDPQGANTPSRYDEAQKGDPVAATVNYTNYIKGASDSLFNESLDDLPPIAYPRVKDYYKANRFIVFGYKYSNDSFKLWNSRLAEVNRNISKTGANAIIVVTEQPKQFADKLAKAWDAHNINDVVTVIGMQGDKVSWVDVRSWSDNSITNLNIRDGITEVGELDVDKIMFIVENAIREGYKLKPMEDFEYLADDIKPPMWVYVFGMIVLLICTPLATLALHKYDIFK